MQAGLINGIQQIQGQMYSLKYDTLPQLKAAASQMPTGTPQYAQLQGQIDHIETQALPGMQAAVDGLQTQITASQKKLKAQASASSGGSSGGGAHVERRRDVHRARSSSATPKMAIGDGAPRRRRQGHLRAARRQRRQPRERQARRAHRHRQDAGRQHRRRHRARSARRWRSCSRASPSATKVDYVYDASNGINASVDGMMREGLLGALFAVIVILLFLRNWRATIIAAVSIPLSILIAMVFLKQTNVTLNVMTLGGLTVAIGRVVDDSIVVIENIFRHLQRGETPNAELIRSRDRARSPRRSRPRRSPPSRCSCRWAW